MKQNFEVEEVGCAKIERKEKQKTKVKQRMLMNVGMNFKGTKAMTNEEGVRKGRVEYGKIPHQ